MPNVGQSIPSLARELIDDVTRLFRQELRLAQLETSEKISSAQNGMIAIVAGLLMAFSALLVLLQALVVGLSNVMEPWLASLVVGVGVAILALILVKTGQSKLTAKHMIPERTIESLRSDRNTLKEAVHEPAR